jgi:hypothetical protein
VVHCYLASLAGKLTRIVTRTTSFDFKNRQTNCASVSRVHARTWPVTVSPAALKSTSSKVGDTQIKYIHVNDFKVPEDDAEFAGSAVPFCVALSISRSNFHIVFIRTHRKSVYTRHIIIELESIICLLFGPLSARFVR